MKAVVLVLVLVSLTVAEILLEQYEEWLKLNGGVPNTDVDDWAELVKRIESLALNQTDDELIDSLTDINAMVQLELKLAMHDLVEQNLRIAERERELNKWRTCEPRRVEYLELAFRIPGLRHNSFLHYDIWIDIDADVGCRFGGAVVETTRFNEDRMLLDPSVRYYLDKSWCNIIQYVRSEWREPGQHWHFTIDA